MTSDPRASASPSPPPPASSPLRCTLVAEIGINHNGSLDDALEMVCLAHEAGADVVKFQRRTLPDCVPPAERDKLRQTPWGRISYLAYRQHVELAGFSYEAIDAAVQRRGLRWTASAWDAEAVTFLEKWDLPFLKIPSARLTDAKLLRAARKSGRPVVLSTGMSTLEEIDLAVGRLGGVPLTLLACTSAYPCLPADCRLKAMGTLVRRYGVPVGYSGHELGTAVSLAAAALGAAMIERHFTSDRRRWGSDQAASLEPAEFRRLVDGVRQIEAAMQSHVIEVLDCEREPRARLRGTS